MNIFIADELTYKKIYTRNRGKIHLVRTLRNPVKKYVLVEQPSLLLRDCLIQAITVETAIIQAPGHTWSSQSYRVL